MAQDDDYDRFIHGVRTLVGIDLSQYRRTQMERRLRTFARRQQCTDLDQYLAHLKSDDGAVAEFRDRMTINVSELFRNPHHFRTLEQVHLPELLARAPGRGLAVWSAGCSYGAELHSVSILLQELAPDRRHRLEGTDIDPFIIERARAGRFREADLRSVTHARRARWFDAVEDDDGKWQVDATLRQAAHFRRHDLLRGRYPADLDLICCRNVVIYFTDEAKEGIYRGFRDALRPGGILFIGATERIANAKEIGLEHVGMFFYRRPL